MVWRPVFCVNQLSSLNYVINSSFTKVFDTRSQDVVDVCLEMRNKLLRCVRRIFCKELAINDDDDDDHEFLQHAVSDICC